MYVVYVTMDLLTTIFLILIFSQIITRSSEQLGNAAHLENGAETFNESCGE